VNLLIIIFIIIYLVQLSWRVKVRNIFSKPVEVTEFKGIKEWVGFDDEKEYYKDFKKQNRQVDNQKLSKILCLKCKRSLIIMSEEKITRCPNCGIFGMVQ
jgi:hypothetical protein